MEKTAGSKIKRERKASVFPDDRWRVRARAGVGGLPFSVKSRISVVGFDLPIPPTC